MAAAMKNSVSSLVMGEAAPTEFAEGERERLDAEATAAIEANLSKYTRFVKYVRLFAEMGEAEVEMAARSLEVHHFKAGEMIYDEGEEGHDCWVVESGTLVASQKIWSVREANKKEWREMRTYKEKQCFGERNLLRSEPRQARMVCRSDVKALKIKAESFVACARIKEAKEDILRKLDLFETMTDDMLAKLAAIIKSAAYAEGQTIASKGEPGTACFIVVAGEATAMGGAKTKYTKGEIFAEHILLEESPSHNATLTAASSSVEVFSLSRSDFEAKLGSLSKLQQAQFELDPRKLLSDFFRPGDTNGPGGSLAKQGKVPNAASPTSWFAVYRPCSRDSIAKMLGKFGVGKGLNIKGKSAKKNRLSGFVPFLQISDNEHKKLIEVSPRTARTRIYYRNLMAREQALKTLNDTMHSDHGLDIEEPYIHTVSDFEPKAFGLDVPEGIVREAYIMNSDITPIIGWETGRASEPAFMDMNLHSTREPSLPSICIYQFDLADPMNPLGLLMAYQEEVTLPSGKAERFVKPVISDFDTFTVGSKGMDYAPLDEKQVNLINWALDRTQKLIEEPKPKGWMGRWLDVLKAEATSPTPGLPPLPKYGFGDETSYSLVGDAVDATSSCGAVRHGAECFNFKFPQELDDEFLVVWDGFSRPPWKSFKEPELRKFLIDRASDGYAFPINPVWPVRDPGWYEVLTALKKSPDGQRNMQAWLPPSSGVVERVERLHAAHPGGFTVTKAADTGKADRSSMAALQSTGDLDTRECADFVNAEFAREVKKRWRRIRHEMIMMLKAPLQPAAEA
jgi:CRP-like cAMP-binding protein